MNLSHYLDLFRHITGLEADVVTAQLHANEPTAGVEDTISISVRYANGAIGSVLGTTAVHGATRIELRLWGRDGHVAIEPRPLVYTMRALKGLRAARWQSFASSKAGADVRAEYFSRLASSLGAGLPPEVTGQDGLAVQAFIEAAYRSAANGGGVSPKSLLADHA